MAVGDINSTERGSGARFNDGKPDLSLIPLRYIARHEARFAIVGTSQGSAVRCLEHLASWQETGDPQELYAAMDSIGAPWEEAAHVLEYGKRKYAAWNWAKGMPWSVTLACAVRHLRAIMRGEDEDPESGRLHAGHVMCNLIFLLTFTDFYQEGDDLPTVFRREIKDAA